MKMRISIVASFILLLTAWGVAKAQTHDLGLFVEPTVTYEVGQHSVNLPSPLSNASGSANGLGVGVRLGLHAFESLFFALDARYSMPQFKSASTNYDALSASDNIGAVIGMQMPKVGMRIWASYVLAGDLNPESSNSVDFKFKQATGYRLGAGFRVAAVSLNLEYQSLVYGQSELEKLGPFSPSTNFSGVNLNNNTWLASVSFPFQL
jgi:hypothetical protein